MLPSNSVFPVLPNFCNERVAQRVKVPACTVTRNPGLEPGIFTLADSWRDFGGKSYRLALFSSRRLFDTLKNRVVTSDVIFGLLSVSLAVSKS